MLYRLLKTKIRINVFRIIIIPLFVSFSTLASKGIEDSSASQAIDTKRIYKKAFHKHETLNKFFDRLETSEFDLGFFSRAIGYYDGGHGVYLHEDLFKSKTFLPQVQFIPFYIAYVVQTATSDILKIPRPRWADIDGILSKDDLKWAQRHFKIDAKSGEVEIGDVYLSSGQPLLTQLEYIENGESQTCLLNKLSIAQVVGIDKSNQTININLALAWMSSAKPPQLSSAYCRFPATYKVKIDLFRNFNSMAIQKALNKNWLNRKQVQDVIGSRDFYDIPKNSDFVLCTGPEFVTKKNLLEELKVRFPAKNLFILETDGSVENTSMTKKNICQASLVQGDVLEWFRRSYPTEQGKVSLVESVGSAFGFLTCRKSDQIYSSSQLTGSHTLVSGTRGSGTSITWSMLAEKQINLLKVRHRDNRSEFEIQNQLKSSVEGDFSNCVFEVTQNTDLVFDRLNLNKKLSLSAIGRSTTNYEAFQIKGNSKYSGAADSIRIPVHLVVSQEWSNANANDLKTLKENAVQLFGTDR